MKKALYLFSHKINGTENSGIIDVNNKILICFCDIKQAPLLLKALNLMQCCTTSTIKKLTEAGIL